MAYRARTLLVLLLALAACSNDRVAGEPETLFDAMNRMRSESISQQGQRNLQIAKCMKQEGFKHFPFSVPSERLPPVKSKLVLSKSYAKSFGYGIYVITKELTNAERQIGRDEYLTSLDLAQHQAYLRSEKTCTINAPNLAVVQAIDRFIPKIQAIEAKVTGTPRFAELQAVWGKCMRNSGYKVASFDDATNIVESHQAPTLDLQIRFEKSVAVKDASCRSSISAEIDALLEDAERSVNG